MDNLVEATLHDEDSHNKSDFFVQIVCIPSPAASSKNRLIDDTNLQAVFTAKFLEITPAVGQFASVR